MKILLAIGLIFIIGCASARAIRYEYENGKAIPIEKMETFGGKTKAVFKDGTSIEGEPQGKIPELPQFKIDTD